MVCECGHERGFHGDCTGPCRRNDCDCRSYRQPASSAATTEPRPRLLDAIAREKLLRVAVEGYLGADRALDALLDENVRLRKALKSIVSEYDGYMGTGQMLREFAQEALDG